MRRAVITGAGAMSGLGVGIDALHDGLAAGRFAVAPIRSWDARAFPAQVAAEVPLPAHATATTSEVAPEWLRAQLDEWLPRRRAGDLVEGWRRAGYLRERKVVLAALAAAEAWHRAGGNAELAGRAQLAIALGLEQAFCEDLAPLLDDDGLDWSRDASVELPALRYRSAIEHGARAVESALDLGGATTIHVSACAAGALAVAHASALIERGDAEVVVCGASDSMVNPIGLGGMAVLGTTSPRAAADACRPFDVRRDGLAMGEGAAMFVVEDAAHARARGARPLADILGWGSTQDAYKLSAPRTDGSAARRAIEQALAHAGISGADVEYVNAHGTGTALNDPAEIRALRGSLGDSARFAVSSIKGAIGHLMAASGALEIAACLLAFERDLLPGTAHLSDRDPECQPESVDIVGPEPRSARIDIALSNSFGFGGQNAAVVLGRPHPGGDA